MQLRKTIVVSILVTLTIGGIFARRFFLSRPSSSSLDLKIESGVGLENFQNWKTYKPDWANVQIKYPSQWVPTEKDSNRVTFGRAVEFLKSDDLTIIRPVAI